MYVRDVMSHDPVTIRPRASVNEAMRQMLDRRISGLPVLDDDDGLIGIVTEGDFLRRVETGTERERSHWLELLVSPGKRAAEYARSHAVRVEELMTPAVISIDADAPLTEAVDLLQRHRIKRLPVLARGRLVGMLSRADVMRACLDAAAVPAEGVADDGVIAACVGERMRRETWCPRENIRVEVVHGVAELMGVVTDERTRDGLRVLVETTPGVLRVVDHLSTLEPMTGAVLHAPD